mgnify:CR=1 FL=1
MNFEVHEFTLGAWWAPAIVNGDYSGLNDDEEKQLNDWLNYIHDSYGDGHWDGFYDSWFGLDEISGLRGNVCEAQYLVPKEGE